MHDFGCSVMSQLKEEDVDRLVAYLDRIYEIAEKESFYLRFCFPYIDIADYSC